MKLKCFSKRALPALLLTVLVGGGAIVGIVYGNWLLNSTGGDLGRQQTATQSGPENPDEAVAAVNGEAITAKEFETFKLLRNQGNSYTDRELLNKMIERRLLYAEAAKQGFESTDGEVDAAIRDVKQALQEEQNREQYEFLQGYLKELNITEEAYWSEHVPAEYKEVLAINKLSDSLRDAYNRKNPAAGPTKDGFDAYYDQYKKDLVQKADIQTDLK